MTDRWTTDIVSADAPGRVNLMGEHTDYHQGHVLPTIIPQRTHVELHRRNDRRVRARSAAVASGWEEYEVGREIRGRGWLDYIQGITMALARDGYTVPGFDATIESSIPIGAGVSSSAALEVSLLRGLRLLASLPIDDIHLARVAQMAETDFVGAPVGIMDQMASSIGREREALLLDTRTLAVDRVPIPVSLEIIVIDSAVPHAHAGGEYATRRRESFEAARLLGVEHLRDAPLDRVEALPPLLARRARHIVTENRRVFETAEALRRGDGPALGVLFAASHASMRDDYETSTAEVDTLVGIGQQHPDVFGARLTGGGFGGAVVMVARAGSGRAAALDIRDRYRARTGRHGEVLVPPGRNLENVSR